LFPAIRSSDSSNRPGTTWPYRARCSSTSTPPSAYLPRPRQAAYFERKRCRRPSRAYVGNRRGVIESGASCWCSKESVLRTFYSQRACKRLTVLRR
jgi:hypothetical protein